MVVLPNCRSVREGARTDKARLQLALMSRAAGLRRYVGRKIPQKLQGVIAAEDILQEVWIAAFRGISGFKPNGPGALDRWLKTIAERELVDKIREARALRRGSGLVPDQEVLSQRSSFIGLYTFAKRGQRTPSREVSAKETSQAVQLALAALPDDQRRVIWLRHIDERSVDQIASALKRTKSSVYGLLRRGLCQLREHLGSTERFFSDG